MRKNCSTLGVATRIQNRFVSLRSNERKGFIAYICAGDPGLEETVEMVLCLEEAGADVVELGVPFSDPLADGVVNQQAAARALKAGATLEGVLSAVRKIRESSDIPLVLFSYLNPLYAFGYEQIAAAAESAGVDGILVLDLPVEESDDYLAALENRRLDNIYLVAPTSTDERIRRVCECGSGFIYCVSREGVTGIQDQLSPEADSLLHRTRKHTDLPIALGFGVSNPEQAQAAVLHADAVVVGSAIVQRFHEAPHDAEGRREAASWVGRLVQAVKEA